MAGEAVSNAPALAESTPLRPLWKRPPALIVVIAILASLTHIAPYIYAASQPPPGWTFSGNLSVSPDVMQYRIWMRRSQETGPLVQNTFTTEENSPHLLVISYWAMGKLASMTGSSPEAVYQFVGVPFAFLLTLLVFAACGHFSRSKREAYWVFAAIMLAGGLSGVMDAGTMLNPIRTNPVFQHLRWEIFGKTLWFSQYRGHYVFTSLRDTHFLIIWTVTLAATLIAYQALTKYSTRRLVMMLVAFAVATLMHIYDGVVLLAILYGTTAVLWKKGEPTREALILSLSGSVVVGAFVLLQLLLWRSGGLPVPKWREVNILLAVVLAAYPLAWWIILPRVSEFWARRDMQSSFLSGWAIGLLAMCLSGPFYAYPSRGSLTLSIALSLIAGSLYFARQKKPGPLPTLIAVGLIGAMPAHTLVKGFKPLAFSEKSEHIYQNEEMRELIALLENEAGPKDILLFDKTERAWRTDDRWLAPSYPGLLYCGHFFLTVDFEAKRARVSEYYQGRDLEKQAAFLEEENIRFVFIGPEHDLAHHRSVAGLRVRLETARGTLLERVKP